MLSGGHNLNEAFNKQTQLINLLSERGSEFRKWLSNNFRVLANISQERLAFDLSKIFDVSSTFSILGINWQAQDDLFLFNTHVAPIGAF